MRGLNKAYFIGNIGHEPELRTTANGKPLLKLNIATRSARKVNDTWVEQPDWHRLTIFGKNAEWIARAAHKGDMIAVDCVVRPNRWTDKDGRNHNEIDLVVERVLWLNQRNRAIPGPDLETDEETDTATTEVEGESGAQAAMF
jgi:single-strand DNA-binding protein